MTIEQWAGLDEDEEGELVDGRLVKEEVPDGLHEVVVGLLITFFGRWLEDRAGVVLGSETKVAVSNGRGRKPDVSVYVGSDRKVPRRGALRRPPDIAIEVISPRPRDARRDRVDKLADYAAFGVRWYWIVDPRVRTVEIFTLNDEGRYVITVSAGGGAVSVPGCEGLSLDVDGLWRKLDSLLEEETPEDSGPQD